MNPPLRPQPGCDRVRREASPARACGRRSRHTRRYVTSLIHLARAMDIQALDRLRLRARQSGSGGVLGLNTLTETLILPTGAVHP
ncbi:hypothetical protein HZU83_10855 [Sphaerotilus montanus]|uniref:Uncharacterized protein n=1 Tax=Sphaerotilus montanus TaxID=522889 RepID=A0A7Y9U8C1_9BURK|nr:hypothetical protein [Sphaerotilus montanus]NYG34707.1 hypothetical protein [Sphaerotilus montanus]NZD57186.1 hypothetical protein [Sphaerotilus montanus]